MLRLLGLSPVAALLTLGGVALAQDEGIIDPWSNVLSGWFAEPSPEARPVTPVEAPGDQTRISAPLVLPLAAVPGDHSIVVEPWQPLPLELAPDPWVVRDERQIRANPAAPAAPVLAGIDRPRDADWAYAIREIIDPWRQGLGSVSRDPLIVDPWAR